MLDKFDFKIKFCLQARKHKIALKCSVSRGFWSMVQGREPTVWVIAMYRCKVYVRKKVWGKILYFLVYRDLIYINLTLHSCFQRYRSAPFWKNMRHLSSLTPWSFLSCWLNLWCLIRHKHQLKPLSQLVHSKSLSSMWILEHIIRKVVPLQPFPWGPLIYMSLPYLAVYVQAILNLS